MSSRSIDFRDILSQTTVADRHFVPLHMPNKLSTLQRRAIRDKHPYFGESQSITKLIQNIELIAQRSTPVLLEGETGTGKSLLARKIHQSSQRTGAFVAINCATFSHNLLETELFGHVKGAFTGAKGVRKGLVTSAENGTLFLDEIADLPLDFQPKLLHLLEEKMIRPVGSDKEQKTSVRIIAATNNQLKKRVKQGLFRADLYYRLNVIPFTIPALRERPEDIVGLFHSFAEQLCEEHSIDMPTLLPTELDLLMQHDWPGNIRELRNHIERCLLLRLSFAINTPANTSINKAEFALKTYEKRHILAAIKDHSGNKTKAATTLGISRRTLDRKLKLWKESAA